MNNNLQLLGMLALLVLVSVLAAREVRRVFRSREPKGHAELAAEQLAYAQRQYLLHRAQSEEHAAMADMYSEQADRLRSYCALYPAPMVVTWKRGDLKSMITPDGPKVVGVGGLDAYGAHAELRKTWAPGQVWEFRIAGAAGEWRRTPDDREPEWSHTREYRRVA